MIRINNLKIRQDLTDDEVIQACIKKSNINVDMIESIEIVKKSIDARNKDDIFYTYSFNVQLKNQKSFLSFKRTQANKNISIIEEKPFPVSKVNKNFVHPPVIIGAGPSRIICCSYIYRSGN